MPRVLLPGLMAQIKKISKLLVRDPAEGYDGVFLDGAVEKKYPKTPKELLHQWFFPQ